MAIACGDVATSLHPSEMEVTRVAFQGPFSSTVQVELQHPQAVNPEQVPSPVAALAVGAAWLNRKQRPYGATPQASGWRRQRPPPNA